MIIDHPLYLVSLVLVGFIVLRYVSLTRRYTSQYRLHGDGKLPPWYPYLLPVLGHSFQLFQRPIQFMYALKETTRLRIPTADPYVIVGSEHIRKFFKTTPSSNPALVQNFVADLFGMPPKASASFVNDPSGRGAIPKAGTDVEARNRVCHIDHDIIQSMLKGEEATEILERLVTSIYKRIDSMDISHEWKDMPDLFEFFTSNISPAMLEAFFGPLLVERVDPHFVTKFWTFDTWVAAIAKRAPRWLFPTGFTARDKLIESLKEWRQLTAEMRANGQETGASRGIMRKLDLLEADDWDMNAVAATDLGFIASFSSNPIPTMFWLGYEIFRTPALLAELMSECKSCLTSESSPKNNEATRFDISGLRSQPLLQSGIAEALRLRTHVFILRYPDEYDMEIDEWRIPKKHLVMACSTTSHMDPSLWNTGESSSRPVTQFWAERFLENPRGYSSKKEEGRKFSSRGLEGIWLPFGGGGQMCPGQLLSKTAISLVTALMITRFDIELEHPEKEVPVSWSHFGAGVIRPGTKVPFRIRRRHEA